MTGGPTATRPTAVRAGVLAGGIACCVGVSYALAFGLSRVVGGDWVWLLATALVAVLVPLTRPALDALADRAAYGGAGDPNAAMRLFLHRISDALAVDDVLPQLARTAAQAVRSPRGEVRVWLADGAEWRQTWPPDAAAASEGQMQLPLQHGGAAVGRLDVEASPEELGATDRELLDRLTGPAGVALANVRLTYELRRRLMETTEHAAELRRSRERLVAARQEQRSRFAAAVRARVDSHLVAADAVLDRCAAGGGAGWTGDGSGGVDGAVREAHAQVTTALECLRELVRGVFPAALTDRGLRAALLLAASGADEPVVVQADDTRYPPEVEAAAFFCAVAVMAELAQPRVSVATDGSGALRLDVSGGGRLSGSTEQLVRDRVAAFGGTLSVEDGEVVITVPTHPDQVAESAHQVESGAGAGELPAQRDITGGGR